MNEPIFGMNDLHNSTFVKNTVALYRSAHHSDATRERKIGGKPMRMGRHLLIAGAVALNALSLAQAQAQY